MEKKSWEPITLTHEGDVLQQDFNLANSQIEDSQKLTLNYSVGMHGSRCRGRIKRLDSSDSHDTLLCENCGLRVPFPRKVDTYGDLRKEMKENFRRDEERRRESLGNMIIGG